MSPVTARLATNITIPGDWYDHGITGLVCRPARWTTVAAFFAANYIAHAATVKAYPGEDDWSIFCAMAIALLLPSFGVARATEALIRRPWMRGGLSGLERALAMRGLVMVARQPGSWSLREGLTVRNTLSNMDRPFDHTLADDRLIPSPASVSQNSGPDTAMGFIPTAAAAKQENMVDVYELANVPLDDPSCTVPFLSDVSNSPSRPISYRVSYPPWIHEGQLDISAWWQRRVHGAYRLPPGYMFTYVPSDALVRAHWEEEQMKCDISVSRSLSKALIGLFQIIYGSLSLYRARGDQIRLYGYSAFGLTVIPYVVMSCVNIAAQVVSADMPALYMVRTPEMTEAEAFGGVFSGVVGHLQADHSTSLSNVNMEFKVTASLSEMEAPHDNQEEGTFEIEPVLQEMPTPRHSFRLLARTADWGCTMQDTDIWIPCCSQFKCKPGKMPSRQLKWTEHPDAKVGSATVSLVSYVWITLAVLGALSKFQKGSQSSSVSRGFVMAWMVGEWVTGAAGYLLHGVTIRSLYIIRNRRIRAFFSLREIALYLGGTIGLSSILFVPPIGGMVVVAKMIYDYGDCTRIE